MYRNSRLKGFTLVELSIVLVIIGLLIGGVLVGQSLVEAANVNKIVRFLSENGIAVSQFQTKYKGLPGDSSKIIGPVSAYNGNDNSILDSSGGANESSTFFQDLYTAGIIKQAYKPFDHYQDFGGYSAPAVPGLGQKTSMRTSVADQSYDKIPALKVLYGNADSVYSGGNYGVTDNYFFIELSGFLSRYSEGAMHAKTAMAIDAKMDDGISNRGGILGYNPFWTVDVNITQPCRSSSQSGKYVVTYPTNGCSLFIRICKAQSIC